MKKNRTFRIAALLLALVLISTCAVTGTLAKYTVGADLGTLNGRVAGFKVLINGKDVTKGAAIGQLYAANGTLYEADLSTAETDFDSINDDALIFPGSGAYTVIDIVNWSEVPVTVNVDTANWTAPADCDLYDALQVNAWDVADGIPTTGWVTINAAKANLATILNGLLGSYELDPLGDEASFAVGFRWLFDAEGSEVNITEASPSTDVTDTALGVAAADAIYESDGNGGYTISNDPNPSKSYATADNLELPKLTGIKINVTQVD